MLALPNSKMLVMARYSYPSARKSRMKRIALYPLPLYNVEISG